MEPGFDAGRQHTEIVMDGVLPEQVSLYQLAFRTQILTHNSVRYKEFERSRPWRPIFIIFGVECLIILNS